MPVYRVMTTWDRADRGNCRSLLLKPPRKREKGETRKQYHDALIEYAMDLDRENPIIW